MEYKTFEYVYMYIYIYMYLYVYVYMYVYVCNLVSERVLFLLRVRPAGAEPEDDTRRFACQGLRGQPPKWCDSEAGRPFKGWSHISFSISKFTFTHLCVNVCIYIDIFISIYLWISMYLYLYLYLQPYRYVEHNMVFYLGLVSAVMSSWGHGISVSMKSLAVSRLGRD